MTQPAFIIIGRNEGPRLDQCLASARPFSDTLIYVDSGSTDNSLSLAQTHGAITVELAPPFTAAKARNAGLARLHQIAPDTPFVMFLDGDTELQKDFIPAALAQIQSRPEIAFICGRRRERFPNASLYNRLCDLEWNTPLGETLACGGDALGRVESILAVGGFNETVIAGEEPELCHRLRAAGHKILRIDAEMTIHDARLTHLSQFLRRQIRSGYGGLDVENRTRAGYFKKEIRRARLWAFYLPLAILIAAITALITRSTPIALISGALAALYPLQFARLALTAKRRGIPSRLALPYALAMTLAKFPNAIGQLEYYRNRLSGRSQKIIEYHQTPQTQAHKSQLT